MLADNFEGKPFGRPNDLVVDKRGGVYFSDDLGIPDRGIKPAVYYASPEGRLIKIADNIERPNGVILSPDEKTLYVANTNGEYVVAFDVQPDGSARNQRNFAKLEGAKASEAGLASGADGLTVDAAGRLYVTTTIGVQVISPEGQHLGTIPTNRPMQNIAFAGPDKKTLYVMGGNAVYRIAMQAQGYTGRAK
jgi:gluconolactonase